jgi:uncharacterized cupredoxin-like copper-binding protein
MRGIRTGLVALSALVAVGVGAAVSTGAVSAQGLGLANAAERAQQASTRMTVTLSEYSIMTEVPSAPAGDITFDVVNTGDEVHEMIVFKSDADIATLPRSASNPGEVDEDQVGEYIGGFEDVQSATGASGTLVLAPGRYILLCNLNKHYENGMVTTFQVN